MKRQVNILILLIAITFLFVLMIGCDQTPKMPDVTKDAELASNTCEGCHTNYTLLKELSIHPTL
jgi:hypothetical protein